MLRVYFDATRVWLEKIVRSPLLSICQEPSLDLDVSAKSSSKGFSNKFGALLALRSSSQRAETGIDEGKFVKLKVRAKGIVDAIIKAVDKKDVPAGILGFWKRLTSDGVYFPESVRQTMVGLWLIRLCNIDRRDVFDCCSTGCSQRRRMRSSSTS